MRTLIQQSDEQLQHETRPASDEQPICCSKNSVQATELMQIRSFEVKVAAIKHEHKTDQKKQPQHDRVPRLACGFFRHCLGSPPSVVLLEMPMQFWGVDSIWSVCPSDDQ